MFHRKKSKGQSVVEFALIFPLFIFMLLGFIDLCIHFFIDSTSSHIVRTAIRFGVTGQQLDNPDYISEIDTPAEDPLLSIRESIIVKAKEENRYPGWIEITAGATSNDVGDTLTIKAWNAATPGVVSDTPTSGNLIEVSLTVTRKFVTPFIGWLSGSSDGSYSITNSTTYQSEKY